MTWRENQWNLTTTAGQFQPWDRPPYETRRLTDALLGGPPYNLLQQLLAAHKTVERFLFLCDHAVFTQLHQPGILHSVRDQQIMALLITHAALFNGEAWLFDTDHSDQPVYDRYGVGSPRPDLWVLGEQANERAQTFPLPFATTAGNHMIWPHVNPRRTRLSNVLEPYGENQNLGDRLQHDWAGLGRPPILAIGNAAILTVHDSQMLRRAAVGTLEHPQYTWRFHHQRIEDWTDEFKTIQWEMTA